MRILGLLVRTREPITITSTYRVQDSPGPIEPEESQVKQGSNNNGSDGEGTGESGESLFGIDRGEGEIEGGGGGGGLRLRENHDESLHLLESLCESALQQSDGGEDLQNANKDARSCNDPDVDRSWVGEAASVLTGTGIGDHLISANSPWCGLVSGRIGPAC